MIQVFGKSLRRITRTRRSKSIIIKSKVTEDFSRSICYRTELFMIPPSEGNEFKMWYKIGMPLSYESLIAYLADIYPLHGPIGVKRVNKPYPLNVRYFNQYISSQYVLCNGY
jgi:hypothetical protein